MGRIRITLLVIMSVCVSLQAKTQYQTVEENLSAREASFLSGSDSLSSYKNKTIKYRLGYSLTAYVNKKTIVPGSPLVITDVDGNSIFKGVAKRVEGPLFAEGVRYMANGKKVFGSFEISNTPESLFTLKPKDGDALMFSLTGIDCIFDYDCENPVIFLPKSKHLYSKSTKRDGYISLSAPVSLGYSAKLATISSRELLLSIKKDAEIIWANKTFKGSVEPISAASSSVDFLLLTGKIEYSDGKISQLSSSNDTLILKLIKGGHVIQYQTPQNSLNKYDWWNESAFIKTATILNPEKKEHKVTRSHNTSVPSTHTYISTDSRDTVSDYSNESSDTDSGSGSVLLYLLGGGLLYWIGSVIKNTRCPHCKKFFALRRVGAREYRGRAKTTKEKDGNGNYYTQYWYNYRYTYRCKYCGQTCVEDRVEK